ncbi:RIMS-binding protein 2 isoform X10 [Xenopus laevis]|uniref:RIMS-binding protein 2 n=1 Tax=Xenopus laevis TaxID=8355 RepID=A0A8J1M3J2_XENLA|nr:RIMS-binding protein 2 isoform X10 [Xenopus laevis]
MGWKSYFPFSPSANLLGFRPPYQLMGQGTYHSEQIRKEKRNDHGITLQESLQPDTKAEKANSTREKEKKRPQKPESSKVGERASKLQGPRAPTKNTEKANAPASTKTKQKKISSTLSDKRPATKKTMRSVNGGPWHPPCPSKDSEREVEIRLLQVECDELRNRLGCLKEGLMGQKPSDVEQLLRQSQKELLWLQRQLSFISNGGPACILSPNKFRNEFQCLPPTVQHRSYSHIQFLEEKSRPFKSDVTAVSPEKLHWNFLEDELKDVVQDKSRLSLQYASLSHRALLYDQVKSDYEQLREALVIVTKERDLAVKEKYQLQAKLENLEQVLTHMREAAERRQQLELEHEQALGVLNAKQQEIDLLQKAQVEAKIEHEDAVQLLENTLDSMQDKVRDLEAKCRTQSEQFNLLSHELEKFRQQAGKIDLLSGNTGILDIPGSPNKFLAQFMNGIATSFVKGNESPTGSRSVISEYIRPLQITGDKPEQLCVKPTFLSRSRSGSPRRRFDCNMDKEQNTNTSKQRYSGKVHLCIARYSYNPFDGPNENPEAELPLVAGKYLYVYGDMDEDGFYEGELLDGQRGLVPSNFVDFVQNDEFHMSSTLASEQEENMLNHSAPLLQSELKLEITPSIHMESSVLNNGTGTTMDVNIDEIGEDIVPYPRKITLIKQLAKSVIVGWEPPLVPPGWGTIHSYNVLVGNEIRATLNFGSRTKLLLEKLDLATVTYRLSIQTITDRGNSDELQCTLLVGKDVIVAPSHLKVDNITPMSAELIWLPSNSNYSHVIFLNDEEYDIVKAASYRYHFFNLKPNMTYKVKLLAKPHQMPWQLPLEQRERKEVYTQFTTLPSGPPVPPENVAVHQGPTPVTVLVTWKPPVLSPTGTSNGAHVTGFCVYAREQKVAEVVFPAAENIVVDLLKLLNLDAKEITVRTLSAQGESEDSLSAFIPSDLLVPPTQHPRTMPKCKPFATAGVPDTKDDHVCPHRKVDESWEHTRTASPVHGHTLEPPMSNFHSPIHGRRSQSPQRILPQPQGAPISNTMAKAMAREAAQRVAESTRNEKRSLFSERSNAVHYANSDEEEEDGYDSPHIKRKGASVDEFLKGSELGKQPHYCPGEDYQTESSRGSDLSDILEEDEEELYSEMQLEDGGRRRVSITSHNTLKLLGNHPTLSRTDHQSRRFSHGGAAPQRPRPMMVPSIEITMDSNSEGGRSRSGSEGNISPVKEEAYYRSLGGHRKWSLQPTRVSDDRYDSYGSREQLSVYEESETDGGMEDFPARLFVALFDYDPRTMSPNPDAAEEELPFKEGQIIKVYGDKDADGFYCGETCERAGFIPCNMISEIQVDDEDMMEQLFKQGFLPLNTPVEKIVNCERFKESSRSVHRRSRKSKRERNRRSGRQHSVTTRRMVALYDYDPRESSPNVDVETELTFCTGDIINVFGEIDEDGFYYGELNGHKGLVPSNFLEEVPDDVEVYLSDTPSRYPQDTPMRSKVKRAPSENTGTPRRAPSPTVHLHSMSSPSSMGSGSPMRGRDRSSKKKKGLLSKGRTFLKKLGAVK